MDNENVLVLVEKGYGEDWATNVIEHFLAQGYSDDFIAVLVTKMESLNG